MKIGISTASLARFETEDALFLLKEVGAETSEVYLKTFYEYRPEFAKKYADRTAGVEVHCVHVNPQNFEPQLFSPSRRVRGDGFYWLEQVLRATQLFGAKNFVCHGFARAGAGEDDFDALGGYISEAANFCNRYGVTLCLENVSFGLYNRPSVFKELKKRCPQLSGVLDFKQAHASDYPYQKYIKDMEGAISAVHITDFDKNGKPCLPNQGVCNFKEIFARLKGAGFDGAVLIDCTNFGEIDELKKSVEFLKETVYNIK